MVAKKKGRDAAEKTDLLAMSPHSPMSESHPLHNRATPGVLWSEIGKTRLLLDVD